MTQQIQEKTKTLPKTKKEKRKKIQLYKPEILENYTQFNVLDVISALQTFSISHKYRFISRLVFNQLMLQYLNVHESKIVWG